MRRKNAKMLLGTIITAVKNGKTQKQFAKELGVSLSTVSRWINRPTLITQASAEALHQACAEISVNKFKALARTTKQLFREL